MGWDASSGWNNLEPDYFGFYKCEIAELLSEDEDFLPSSLQTPVSAENFNGNKTSHYRKEYNSASSSSLFSNCIGPEVSGIKMGLLKSLLRQGVFALSEEVDEVCYESFSPFFNLLYVLYNCFGTNKVMQHLFLINSNLKFIKVNHSSDGYCFLYWL